MRKKRCKYTKWVEPGLVEQKKRKQNKCGTHNTPFLKRDEQEISLGPLLKRSFLFRGSFINSEKRQFGFEAQARMLPPPLSTGCLLLLMISIMWDLARRPTLCTVRIYREKTILNFLSRLSEPVHVLDETGLLIDHFPSCL